MEMLIAAQDQFTDYLTELFLNRMVCPHFTVTSPKRLNYGFNEQTGFKTLKRCQILQVMYHAN